MDIGVKAVIAPRVKMRCNAPQRVISQIVAARPAAAAALYVRSVLVDGAPQFPDLLGRHRLGGVAPTGADVGDQIGDLLVIE